MNLISDFKGGSIMLEGFSKRQKARNELNQCFMNMGLLKTYKNSSGNQYYAYPIINAVKFNEESTQFVFTLLNEMDPKELMNKEDIIKQSFGQNIELEGDNKRFTLTIHNK